MVYQSLSDFDYRQEQAIIINVGTRFVSTLALLSCIKYSKMPVLLIDCPIPEDDHQDFGYFQLVMEQYNFDLIQLPLQSLGKTWEYIFKNLNADYILFVDSDLEILNLNYIEQMRISIKRQNVFGSGFTHGGLWFKKEINWEEKRDGLFELRIWTPLTMLNVKMILEAMDTGISFECRFVYNVFPKFQHLSRKLLYSKKINNFRFLKDSSYSFFNCFKKTFYNQKPLIVFYDTGSDMYQYLRYQKNYMFAGYDIDSIIEEDYLKHYSGITRKLLYGDPFNTGSLDYIKIKNSLLNDYSFDYENWNKKYLNNK